MDMPLAQSSKTPRTERGRRTLRKLLDAAAEEFGSKGFHEASISSITRRAEVALGTFYTYFDSKDALFQALVRDLSSQVKHEASQAVSSLKAAGEFHSLDVEETALESFLQFAKKHKEIYRIIDESEFVDPAAYRAHYENTAARILERLQAGAAKGEFRDDLDEAHAWAVMGMNVFLGLRYSIWATGTTDLAVEDVARIARSILRDGLSHPQRD